MRPHIGLGRATAIDLLEIRWPGSGLVQQFKGPLAVDRIYQIREGDPEPAAVEVGSGVRAAAQGLK